MATKRAKKAPPKNLGGRPRTGRKQRFYWILDSLHENLVKDAEEQGKSASQLLEIILAARESKEHDFSSR